MPRNLVNDIVPKQSETHLRESSAVAHPPDQFALAPREPVGNPVSTETAAEEQARGALALAPRESPAALRVGRDRLRRPWRYVIVPLFLLLALAAGIGGGIIGARLAPVKSATTPSLQQQIESVSLSVQPSVVEVRSEGASSGALGSGVILTKDGYIATNDHVIQGYSTFTVLLSNGQSLTAQRVGEDDQDDLAVLKVKASNLTPIAFADSSTVKIGQFVIALGSPLGLEDTTTFGIVSALNRTVTETTDSSATIEYYGMIQVDMTLNPGNSGGALIDLQGRLIGIPNLRAESTSKGVDVDGIGFVIPANRVKTVTTQLIKTWTAGQ